MKRITIIGGGASGTLLAVNLLRRGSQGGPLTINLVESSRRLGRGVAFGAESDSHLLNVPAEKMGAFPDDVGHFHRWLDSRGHEYGPHSFVPRRLFGDYLRSLFTESINGRAGSTDINMIDDEAVRLTVGDDGSEVTLASGEVLLTDKVVLAFGNFPPPDPNVPDLSFTSADTYFNDPWDPAMYDAIDADSSIFVIGTGLSMVDVAVHCRNSGQRGKLFAISTKGLLPERHKLGYTYPPFHDELQQVSRVTDLLKTVRRHARLAQNDSSDWRAVIDSLRPVTQSIWLGLPVNEKRYFMQHLSRYWNVARHRMPPEAADIVDEMQSDGHLTIFKGRLRAIEYGGEGFKIMFHSQGVERTVDARVLINCIGSESNYHKIDSALVRDLIANGYMQSDELTQGVNATPDGRLIDRTGAASNVIFTLGTALKGILLESTAIPEIRAQASELASTLLAD